MSMKNILGKLDQLSGSAVINEGQHKSDIPAILRKSKGARAGDWKVSLQDLEDEKLDNLSSPESIRAKNTAVKSKLKDWMEKVEGKKLEESLVNEGKMAEVDMILQDIASGQESLSRIMKNPKNPVEQYVKSFLSKKIEELGLDQVEDKSNVADALLKHIKKEFGDDLNEATPVPTAVIQGQPSGNVGGATSQNAEVGFVKATGTGPATAATQTYLDNLAKQKLITVVQPQQKAGQQAGQQAGQMTEGDHDVKPSEKLQSILKNYPYESKLMEEGYGLHESLYQVLCDHYWEEGRIPRDLMNRGGKELRDWVEECYAKDVLSSKEELIGEMLPEDEYESLEEEYMGHEKLTKYLAAKGAEDPKALASWIGRKKYGKTKFQKAAAAGKQLGENDMGINTKKISEAKGRLIKGRQYGADDVEFDSDDDTTKKAAEPAVKRGRGRPRKGADSETGQVADYSGAKALQDFMVGNLPGGKLPGKKGRVHKIEDEPEKLDEKAVSKAQQQAAAIALKAKREGKKPQEGTASAEMADMSIKELEKFAGTKRKGLPKHVKEDAQVQAWNKELNTLLNEGMTITTSTGNPGGQDSVSISATDEDAKTLLKMIQDAGLQRGTNQSMSTPSSDVEAVAVEPVSADEVMGTLEPEDDGHGDLSFIKRMIGARGDHGSCEECGHADCKCDHEVDEMHNQTASSGDAHMSPVPEGEEVDEELHGGQKKLDVNKNGKLDAGDFEALRAKKDVKEGVDPSYFKDEDLNEESLDGELATMEDEMCEGCGSYMEEGHECGSLEEVVRAKIDTFNPKTGLSTKSSPANQQDRNMLAKTIRTARNTDNWRKDDDSYWARHRDIETVNGLPDRFSRATVVRAPHDPNSDLPDGQGPNKGKGEMGKPGISSTYVHPNIVPHHVREDGDDEYSFDEQDVSEGVGLRNVLEGAIKDAVAALAKHAQNKVDYEQKYGPMSAPDLHQYEAIRKQLLDKKRRAQAAYTRKQDAALGLTEWANTRGGSSHDEQFIADIAYLTKSISGGLNNIKQDQTVVPSARVKTGADRADAEQSLAELLRKLGNIN